MKNIVLLSFILLKVFHCNGQTDTLAWFQFSHNSCWAASLALVSKEVDHLPKNQCFFISVKEPGVASCNPCTMITRTAQQHEMQQLAQKYISGYGSLTNDPMSLGFMTKLINIQKKPIIYNFGYGGSTSHIVVMSSIETNITKNSRTAMFRIKDPWPKCVGNEYYSTYERYYLQDQISETTPIDYTIFYSKFNIKPSGYAVTKADNNYLKKVLHNSDENNLIKKFLESIDPITLPRTGGGHFSDDFFIITNLPKDKLQEVIPNQKFNVRDVAKGQTTFDSGSHLITLENILNLTFHEKIICLNQMGRVRTIVSVSKAKSEKTIFSFYNNWILYHIEKGQQFDQFFKETEAQQNSNYQVYKDKEGIILRFADSEFILYKNHDEYFVYDVYGNGFDILGLYNEQRYVDFKTFNTAAFNFTLK